MKYSKSRFESRKEYRYGRKQNTRLVDMPVCNSYSICDNHKNETMGKVEPVNRITHQHRIALCANQDVC